MKTKLIKNELNTVISAGTDEQLLMPGLSAIYSPDISTTEHVRDLLDVLLENNSISSSEVKEIRENFKRSSDDITGFLIRSSKVSLDEILRAKAVLYGLEYRKNLSEDLDANACSLLSVEFIKKNLVLPFAFADDELLVATSEPENIFIIDDVKRQTGYDVQLVLCSNEEILNVCDILAQENFDIDLNDIVSDISDVEVVQDEEEESDDLEKMAGQSPVIKFVNYLISNAIHEKASDIHIEPKEKHSKVRYRIDGALFENMQIPAKMHPAVVSRIKIMSNLDISERRLPQDGKVAVIIGGRNIDLRISILPTSHGEKVVIRILDSKSILRGLDGSGMGELLLEQFKKQISLPNGIFLVTGPTGSGKSTPFYSDLSMMDGSHVNISTVEDPVEYDLEFCNQIQVQDKIGMTFSAALRSLLRQDPDIIMVGEIRDAETAQISVRAALTGHLVFSTLHTNDASSSITRLVNIGIDPYLIAAALNGVLAQRLVRRICSNCKEPYRDIPDSIKEIADRKGIAGEICHGRGCDKCRNSGYAGRVGIFEFLEVDDTFRDVINKDPSIDNMRNAFIQSGNKTLFDDGMDKVAQGLTTVEEILRVTQA